MSCYGTCFCQSNNEFYISYTNTIIDPLHILLYIHVYYIFTRECLIKLRFSGEDNRQVDRVRCEELDGGLSDALETHSLWSGLSAPLSVQHRYRGLACSHLLQMVLLCLNALLHYKDISDWTLLLYPLIVCGRHFDLMIVSLLDD